ncbi:hypothetical protein LCGC14_0810470 [marine sediment metagenome]|uniref:Uncharacterized protein n=1 Tax=marine sediment metagenome TaxID=412755 RepID=A0A0F9SUE9_9ZZZZ
MSEHFEEYIRTNFPGIPEETLQTYMRGRTLMSERPKSKKYNPRYRKAGEECPTQDMSARSVVWHIATAITLGTLGVLAVAAAAYFITGGE